MEEFRPIEFQRTRDFSRKLNATFEFVRQNYKALGKAILMIAGPSVLVGSLLIGSFMGDFMSLTFGLQSNGGNPEALGRYFLSPSFWLQMLLIFVLGFVSLIVTIATINCYLVLYGEKKTNQIEVSEVWDRVRSTFWSYVGTTVLFFIGFIIVYIVLFIPVVLLGAISPVLIFFGFLIFICGLIYLGVSSSLTYFAQLYEQRNFFDAISRSFRLVNNGKWWSTFGLLLVLLLIVFVTSYIFLTPYYIIFYTSALHSVSSDNQLGFSDTMRITTIVCFTLYYLAQLLLYALPHVGIAFQYFNLVELKEAKGLMGEINTFGQAKPDEARPQEQF